MTSFGYLHTAGGAHVKTGTFCENGSSLACASNDGLIALIKLGHVSCDSFSICNCIQD